MRVVARVLCGLTFFVVGVGGLVTTTKAGMAVPDWPNTYGYNLFLYPWETWFWGPWDLFVEHGHRLAASAAGFCTIVLLVLLWRDRAQPRWLVGVGGVALVAVIVQGILGGMRVVLDDRWFAMTHAVIGPTFFGVTVGLVVWTSGWWRAPKSPGQPAAEDLRVAAMMLLTVIYTQLMIGAVLRHLPAHFSPHTFLAIARFHLLFAALVVVAWLAVAVGSRRGGAAALRWPVRLGGLLITSQILLGLVTWCYKYAVPSWVEERTGWTFGTIVADSLWQSITVTAHQANGSLLLAISVWLMLGAWRFAPAHQQTFAPSMTSLSGPARRATT